jgi:hypothetical protein
MAYSLTCRPFEANPKHTSPVLAIYYFSTLLPLCQESNEDPLNLLG